MSGISVLIKETPEGSLILRPVRLQQEDAPSVNQEEGSHQISNLLALIWDFPVPELIKEVATEGKERTLFSHTGLFFKNALGSWRWRVSL